MAERRTPLPLIRGLCDRLDNRIQAGSSLAEACQIKPKVDADRSARDTGAVDALGPHSQVTLDPTDRRRSSDGHRLLEPLRESRSSQGVGCNGAAAKRLGGQGTERDGPSFGSARRNWSCFASFHAYPIYENRTCRFRTPVSEPISERHARPRHAGVVRASRRWATSARVGRQDAAGSPVGTERRASRGARGRRDGGVPGMSNTDACRQLLPGLRIAGNNALYPNYYRPPKRCKGKVGAGGRTSVFERLASEIKPGWESRSRLRPCR